MISSTSNSRNIDLNEFDRLTNDAAKLKFLIKFGALAPSSHNTQPWFFRIKNRTIKVLGNTSRILKIADRQTREYYISIACAYTNILLAANAYGLKFECHRVIEESEVASITFSELNSSNKNEKELVAIIDRQNSRQPFNNKNISSDFFKKIIEIAGEDIKVKVIREAETKNKIIPIILESVVKSFLDRNFTYELANWFRPSFGTFEDGLVGSNVGIPYLVSMIMPWMLRHLDLSKRQKEVHRRMLINADAYIILSTMEDRVTDWLKIGEAFEKIAVEAQKHGISLGVMQASIETDNDFEKIQKLLNISDRPQMFFRLGYTDKKTILSPRLNIDALVVE